jgi:AcrR family transcriptional regulator
LVPYAVKEVSVNRKEQAAETEAALKAAAKRLFAERGYLNTKTTDISAEAGRAAGSFYTYFASKEELLEALLADMSAAGDTAAAQPGHKPDFTDPEAIRWHLAIYLRFLRDNAATIRALQQAALVSDCFAATLARFEASQMADVLGHIERLTDAGFPLPAPPAVSLQLMFGLADAFLQARQRLTLDISDEEAVEALTRFVYRGLTGRDY